MKYCKSTLQLILICCSTLNYSQSQEKNYLLQDNRKGQLFFKVSSEYRLTPLPYEQPTAVPVPVDNQNSGIAFSYALDYFVTENLNLGFSNSFRYDYLGGDFDDIEPNFGAEPANRGLIIGYHFYIDYHFQLFNESELYLRLGRSLLNRGTQINVKRTFFNEDTGEILFSQNRPLDLSYEPWNFGIGWKKRKLEILLGIYTSGITEYFIEPEDFIVPYFKLSYNLGRL